MNTAIAPMPSELINAYTDFYFAAPNVAALEESLGISLNDPPEGVYVDYIGKAEKTPPIYSNDDPENATIVLRLLIMILNWSISEFRVS